jgi:hypothetical protein
MEKPFTDGKIINECMMEAVAEMCPDKMISLAPNTVARRTENMGNNTVQPTVGKAQRFSWYSLAVDESTDEEWCLLGCYAV